MSSKKDEATSTGEPSTLHPPVLCTGLFCLLAGADQIDLAACTDLPWNGGDRDLQTTTCLGYCHLAPVVRDREGRILRLQAKAGTKDETRMIDREISQDARHVGPAA